MSVIVRNQGEHMIADTLAHLTELCNSSDDIIQEKPFLLMAACFYLGAAAFDGHVGMDEPLVKLILNACRMENKPCDDIWGVDRIDDVIDAVYHHHNPPQTAYLSPQSLDRPTFSTPLPISNPNGHDNV